MREVQGTKVVEGKGFLQNTRKFGKKKFTDSLIRRNLEKKKISITKYTGFNG